jgi:predicted esterase
VIEEHHLAVPRTARYYTLGVLGPQVTEVWFALHGYGQLGSAFARHCQPLEAPERVVVVPEALSRFYLGDHTRPAGPDSKIGASWMTREDRLHEIADYVQYLDRLYQWVFERVRREAVTVHVLGFSQGTASATRWLTRGEAHADRLILWGAPLPADLDPALDAGRLRHLEVVLVAGSQDEYLTAKVILGEERRLTEMGVRHRVLRFEGTHTLDAGALRELTGKRGTQ